MSQIVQTYLPNKNLFYFILGLGVEVHCSDVGLGDPSVTAKLHIRTEKNRTESESGTKSDEPTSYQEWIKQAQVSRNTSWKFNVALHESKDTANPPHFDKVQNKFIRIL